MKKILLLVLSACFAVSSYSQGEVKTMTNFNFSLNQPLGSFGESVDNDQPENRFVFLRDNKDEFNHIGGAVTFGGNFYIHPTEIFDGFKLGVAVDFIDLGANYMTFVDQETKNISGTEELGDIVDCADLTARFSMNLGPVVTYSPAKNFLIDVSFRVRPTIANHWFKYPEWVIPKDASNPDDIIIVSSDPIPPFERITDKQLDEYPIRERQEREANGFGYGTKFSAGLDIRYAKVLIGAEYVFGNVTFKYDKGYVSRSSDKLTIVDSYLKAKIGFFFAE